MTDVKRDFDDDDVDLKDIGNRDINDSGSDSEDYTLDDSMCRDWSSFVVLYHSYLFWRYLLVHQALSVTEWNYIKVISLAI